MKVVLPLTELKIRNLKPKDKKYKIFNGGSSGLYLETLPSGTKSWRIQHGAKKKRMPAFPGALAGYKSWRCQEDGR
jgi:hypothetical protein